MQRYEIILDLQKNWWEIHIWRWNIVFISHNQDSLYIWMILHYQMYYDILDIWILASGYLNISAIFEYLEYFWAHIFYKIKKSLITEGLLEPLWCFGWKLCGKVWLLLTNRRLYCPMLLVACVHAQPRNQVGYPGESTKVEIPANRSLRLLASRAASRTWERLVVCVTGRPGEAGL